MLPRGLPQSRESARHRPFLLRKTLNNSAASDRFVDEKLQDKTIQNGGLKFPPPSISICRFHVWIAGETMSWMAGATISWASTILLPIYFKIDMSLDYFTENTHLSLLSVFFRWGFGADSNLLNTFPPPRRTMQLSVWTFLKELFALKFSKLLLWWSFWVE